MAANKAQSHSEFKPIYVIAGSEDGLVSAECEKLLDRLIEPDQRQMALLSVDADKAEISDIFDELRTAPFLTDKRVVVIRRADDFISKYRESLEKYFEKPSPSGILVMTVGSWRSNTRLAKKLPDIGSLISCEPPKGKQLPRFLIDYAKTEHNKTLPPQSAELLIEFVGDDVSRLKGEVDKLAVYIDKNEKITPQDIESLISHNRSFNVFAVIDAITAGQPGAAVEKLRKMFADDKSAEYTAIGAFAFQVRRMFDAKALLQKGVNQFQITKQLRIWSNTDAFFAQLRRLTLRQIGSIMENLAELDYEIKTGKATPQTAIEQLVVKLATR